MNWTILKAGILNNLTLLLYVVTFGGGLYFGWYFTANHFQARELRVKEAVIEQLARQAEINRKISEDYHSDIVVLRDAYTKLGKKIYATKITTTPCTFTSDGIRLWNESLLGAGVLPETPSGITGSGETSIAEAFENKIENDERCASNVLKLDKLKQWTKEQFGED